MTAERACEPAHARRAVTPDVDALVPAVDWVCARLPAWLDRDLAFLGVTEALTNALIHGVFQLAPEIRSDLDRYLEALAERSRRARETEAEPALEVSIVTGQRACSVAIRWRGAPFPRERMRRPAGAIDPMCESGRGMRVIYETCGAVTYSDDGLEIRLLYRR